MANTLRIKRRASGVAGAPTVMAPAELAYNEVDDILYYGKGSGGAGGSASAAEAIAGKGIMLQLSGNQTIDGVKTFNASPLVPTPAPGDNTQKAATTAFVQALVTALGAGDMLKSVYDANNSGVVDDSERLGGALAAAYALLDSPAFTGTPTAPTPLTADDSTKIATTQYVRALITLLSAAANGLATLGSDAKVPASQLPAFVDDVQEFANLAAFPATGTSGIIYIALDTHRSYRWSGTVYTAIAAGNIETVFTRSGNIVAVAGDYNSSQVTNSSSVSGAFVTDALATLGGLIAALGTMSAQNANAVAITGGTIDGITLDGGTF